MLCKIIGFKSPEGEILKGSTRSKARIRVMRKQRYLNKFPIVYPILTGHNLSFRVEILTQVLKGCFITPMVQNLAGLILTGHSLSSTGFESADQTWL